ncbi:MORN repeat variant [Enhygromyxa salina]|uniref:MORN repeat variant n=1 Tax=Enhygromyxa salina TaxID=215803 RepID=A0A2S9Y7D5_9BACT|nr:toxin-antitoxin system YwqK family antitoxin [Enhygromyxa salina]PRQ01013.1 MORN repeat variant [Enhygromyxa salina]
MNRRLRTLTLAAVLVIAGASAAAAFEPAMVVDESELVLAPLEGRWYYEGEAFEGRAEVRGEDGRLLESTEFAQGKKHGEAISFHANGQPRRRATYVMNRLAGRARAWSPSGVLIEESNYKDGVRHGVQRTWHSNGPLAKERHLVDGHEQGMQRAWTREGKIYVNYEYKNGRRFGLRRSNLCLGLDDGVIQL